METSQIQRNQNLKRSFADVYELDEELVCANCGYFVSERDRYDYHVKLCSIPA